jgi:alkanesulfonate monooxygenase SsuD/methylene tetrahydromethanopterin reductase-like flavin-dependent oxidoreductase (luciferase family)
MDVGLQLLFASYGWDNISDGAVYREDLALARRAEALGFDAIWPVEHHFFDYSFCPDNLQVLSYLAGQTERIALGTAAVILPWNEPLRVAEKVSLLDHLSGGRVRFGMGRGLSRREFAPFRGVAMSESRARFDEASAMIVRALETGFIEGDGPYYVQPRTAIRPRPEKSFADRIYAVANSADSVDACASIGGRMILFAETHWERRLEGIERHRSRFRELHSGAAPPVMVADFTFCHPDREYAHALGERCLASYLASILEHYELMSDHFANTEGYRGYGKQAEHLRRIGFDKYVDGFLASNAFGTPDEMLAKFRARYEVIGPFELATCFRFGGIPFAEAEQSMALFAKEVLPELKRW